MNKIFAIILLLNLLYSKPVAWSFEQELELQKDEMLTAAVSHAAVTKDFSMRWTLLKKDGIVVLLQYDGFVHQVMLYPDINRNRFILKLENTGDQEDSNLMLVFKSFENQSAKFWLGVQGNVDFAMR